MEAAVSSSLGVEAAVSSSLGVMGPLLRKLDLLLEHNYWLPKRVEEGIELLKEDMEEVSSAFLELLMVATTSLRAKCWMEEARELSYDVEDFVDNMIRTRTKSGMIQTRTIAEARMRSARGARMCHVKIAGLPALPKRSTRISRIETFRTLLREASERYERYQLDYCCSSSSPVTTGHNQTPALYGDAANLVGINDSKIKLKEMLTIEGDQQLKVVSIVGPAGLGKSTLAKEVYREVGKQFEFQAFVRVSRKPDMRRLLGAILSQVRQHKQPPFNAVPVQHLIDIIKEHFRDKRYFIVIDDLWERTAWDILCAAFPHGDNSSRIIVTTENVNVSLGCCGYRHSNILKMRPLNFHDSEKLFFSRVFSSKQCPDEMKEISHGIIRDCGGFPLAIINVAGLLASQLDYSELWYHVQDNLCSIVNRTCTAEEMQKEILNLCYNSLPHCLKTCLLYFTMYPEGYIIRKVDVVKQWIAEGFVNATDGKQNVEISDSYFDELVNRGMIQPVEIDYNDGVLSCTVHHIVLDFITQKCKEEKFISAIDCSQTVTGLSTKFHRLSFYFSSARYGKPPAGITMSKSRSLAFFGLVKRMPSIVKFKLLRVLILEIWGNHHEDTSVDISRVYRLLQLRYLKVSSDIVVELPTQMRELLYLETLEIDARICAVPLDIVRLPRLMHLCLRGATNLPDGIGRIKSLCTLQYFDLSSNSESNVWSLGKLTNLRHLHLTCSPTLSDEHLKRKLIPLVSSLRKFSNLKYLTLTPDASGRALFCNISSSISTPCSFLQRLELFPPICFFSRLPSWLWQLHGLRILNIVIRDLESDDISILTGLPALTVLSLYVRTALKQTIILADMAFSALRYLKLSCSVMLLSFQEGAMPDLRRLKLCYNSHRENNYGGLVDGIEHLLNLREVAARIGEPQGTDKLDRQIAESLFVDAIKKHPRSPSIDIRWVNLIDEECPPLSKQHQRLQQDSSGENDKLERSSMEDMNIPSAGRFSEIMHLASASKNSEAVWQMTLGGGESMESGPYPERPGEADCIYYLRTGLCRFGMTCKFNHPPNRNLIVAAERIKGDYPHRAGQPECQYYLRTGTCKFGAACKFHHPREKAAVTTHVQLNVLGYPLRPNEKECAYYVRTGQCKFAKTCKFHHPEPSNTVAAVHGHIYSPGQSATSPGQHTYPGVVTDPEVSRSTSFIANPPWPGHSVYPHVGQGLVQAHGWNPYAAQMGPTSLDHQQRTSGTTQYYTASYQSEKTGMGAHGMFPSYQGGSVPVEHHAVHGSVPVEYYAVQGENIFPERPDQPECQFYMKTGDCKFGAVCKFNHPKERLIPVPNCALSPLGLPLRPGKPICTYYCCYGKCKFGPNCKFDHPIGSLYGTATSPTGDAPMRYGQLAPSPGESERLLDGGSGMSHRISQSDSSKYPPAMKVLKERGIMNALQSFHTASHP